MSPESFNISQNFCGEISAYMDEMESRGKNCNDSSHWPLGAPIILISDS